MDLNTDNLATNSKLPGQLADNFKQLIYEDGADDQREAQHDANHTATEQKLDQKYSQITDDLLAKYADLKEGEDKLDSDKASKVMLYKWFKELDDKFSACVDDLDDKKASKKHLRKVITAMQALIKQYHDDFIKTVNDNAKAMNDKAERVALGTDMDTIRQAVTLVLQEQGIIPNDQVGSSIPSTSNLENDTNKKG